MNRSSSIEYLGSSHGFIQGVNASGSRTPVSPVEKSLAIAGLLLSTGAGARWIGEGTAADGSLQRQLLWMAVYALSGLVLVSQSTSIVHIPRGTFFLWMFLGFSVISVYWSNYPEISTRRLVALLGSTLFGIYLAVRYSRKDLIKLLLWVTGIGAILSLVLAVTIPHAGIGPGTGWVGIFGQKNSLGRMMVLVIVVWVFHLIERPKNRMMSVTMLAMAVALLLLARSTTSLVIVGGIIPIIVALRFTQRHGSIALPLLLAINVAFVGAVLWSSSSWSMILKLLGKEPTLTGRTNVWREIWPFIQDRYWNGYGYGGFWVDEDGPSGQLWDRLFLVIPGAHNGFLDLWLDVGLIGLMLFAIAFFATARRSWQLVMRQSDVTDIFPLVFLILLLALNFTESSLVAHNSLNWILFVTISLNVFRGCEPKSVITSGHPIWTSRQTAFANNGGK